MIKKTHLCFAQSWWHHRTEVLPEVPSGGNKCLIHLPTDHRTHNQSSRCLVLHLHLHHVLRPWKAEKEVGGALKKRSQCRRRRRRTTGHGGGGGRDHVSTGSLFLR
ncbi:hypothetical protein BHM03_00029963 [Ensete ventricosum]|uniref:Uncharacterized protein n=1 Tax=Ensete ventricosum TaxID=4639 RepID=A0A445MI33_ENSVE|nr:hypothetical protein BHM03_00029963 [Ensete ventricosum]